jgi:hypothetical protein
MRKSKIFGKNSGLVLQLNEIDIEVGSSSSQVKDSLNRNKAINKGSAVLSKKNSEIYDKMLEIKQGNDS